MDYKKLHLLIMYSKDYGHSQAKLTGISNTEHLICSYVYNNDKCNQEDIVKTLGIDKTTVGKAIQSLENKKYLTRTQNIKDKRKNDLSLSELGLNKINSVLSLYDKWLDTVLSTLNESEKNSFENYLDRILEKAKEMKEGKI